MSITLVGDFGGMHNPHPLCSPEQWTLKISGLVEEPLEWSLPDIAKLPQQTISIQPHCVSVGKLLKRGEEAVFSGVAFSGLLSQIPLSKGPSGEKLARTVGFYSKAPGAVGPLSERHHTFLELDYCLSSAHLLLAGLLDGKPLSYKHGGPLRTVVGPDRFFYKSIKWLEEIRFFAEPLEELRGTWEMYAGYHNRGRTAENERFEPFFRLQSLKGGESRAVVREYWQRVWQEGYDRRDLSRFVVAQLHQVMDLGRDFSGCVFAESGHHGQFRGINFKQALFYGAKMEGANFALSKFPSAKFSGEGKTPANLKGADLEGAVLIGAVLSGVNMEGAYLAGAQFYSMKKRKKAIVEGLNLRGAIGLDPLQKSWLNEDGAIL